MNLLRKMLIPIRKIFAKFNIHKNDSKNIIIKL